MNFAAALKQLANDDSLDISDRDREKMRRVVSNKRRCKRVEERAELEAHREGSDKKLKRLGGDGYGDGSGYGFDWSTVLDKLMKWLPEILDFIKSIKF